ncbi:bifunctional methylenetetrahydrofolate dehydrogenase/methenyltetrahydrofolate cyclohydrolase [bacterium J17]|nr:bifunctional methylenetetrahydrofolate dehydrogenase/methenyltetrahydrofolate cyclohydrolase [bacterium J17]
MSAKVIDGKLLAKEVREGLAARVAELTAELGRAPCLAVVLVGEDPASKVYVKSKSKAASKCGIDTLDVPLPADIDDQALQAELRALSAKENLDGILLQLPLPRHLDEFQALLAIDPKMDVDGLHPYNQGLLARGEKSFKPCTPKGCVKLIHRGRELLGQSNNLEGLDAVVVGRSILVGKPMAFLLLEENCTVSVAHSRTKDLGQRLKSADILVAAVGRANMITGEMVKPGAIVIDVGINRLDDGSLVGDVEYNSASEIAGAITPVPGGVGPMTIAMLLENTVDSARAKVG